MALLGYAVTNQFLLGSFEVRAADLSQAGNLTSSHSVGVVDGVTLGFELTQVDVLNGTSSLIDRNVVRQLATIQFVFREFSARNWRMALGQSVDWVVGSSDTSELEIASRELSLRAKLAGIMPGDKVRTNLSVEAIISQVTYLDGLPVLTFYDLLAEGTNFVTIYRLDGPLTSTPAGKTPYQTLQLVQQDRTSDSYLVWDFWKVALDGGFEASINHTDFASAAIRFKTFDVTDSDVFSSSTISSIINQCPVFRYHKTTTI